MSKNNITNVIRPILENKTEEQTPRIKDQYLAKMSGNLTSLISQGFNDATEYNIFTDSKGVSSYGTVFKVKEKNTKLEAFYIKTDPINTLSEEVKKEFEKLVNDKVILANDIDTFTKKLFHLFHVYAFYYWHSKIEIAKADICRYFDISDRYLRNNLTMAIYTLRRIEIIEFTTKRRYKGTYITGGNDIKQLFTKFNTNKRKVVSLTFSLEYVKYLFDYGFIQYPIKIFSCNSSVAFDILEYIYRYYFLMDESKRKTTFVISRNTILKNVKSIPSFEFISKEKSRNYRDYIKSPFDNAISKISENYAECLQIEPVYTKEEMNQQDEHCWKETIETWRDRKLRITLIDAPDYSNKKK